MSRRQFFAFMARSPGSPEAMRVRASSVARLISARVMSPFKDVPQLPATFGSVCTSDVGPHVREHGILEGACPVAIHESEEILRGGITCSTARRYQRAASASSVRTTALSPKNQDQEFISGQRDVQWPYC